MEEVDDVIGNLQAKKIKSGQKGKRAERGLVNDLNKRFASLLAANPPWGQFSRSVGSGNRWGQNVFLSKNAKEVYSGDLTCPSAFKFVVESKGGYNEIDLCSAFDGGCKELDGFLQQVSDDSGRCGRKPLLVWKKDRKPRVAFVKSEEVASLKFDYSFKYREWTAISFEELLKLPDDFFFEAK